MAKKKLPKILIIAFLSLCFFGTIVWAATENNGGVTDSNPVNINDTNSTNEGNGPDARAITLQDTSTFIGEHQGNEISDNHSVDMDTEIWAFLTNNGQEKLRTADSVIDLTLLLQNSEGQQIGEPHHIIINAGESSGSTKIVFPTSGQYQLHAFGTITNVNNGSGTKTEDVSYTTNKFWIGNRLDHFEFVDSSGSKIINPNLTLRADVNSQGSTWSYIGEPMLLDVYLQAYTKEETPIKDYLWDFAWFADIANWSISCTDPLQRVDSSKLSYSMLTPPRINQDSILHAQFMVYQGDANRDKVIRNVSLSVKPMDVPGVKPMVLTSAVVSNSETEFTLYGGQIRVAQAYFYQEDGWAQVYVEKYDDGFVQNKDDSLTSVNQWDLSGAKMTTNDFQFQSGSGTVLVHSDTSNITKTLTPIGVPSYFQIVPGELTWGQIVNNSPPQNLLRQDEGPVWEREVAP